MSREPNERSEFWFTAIRLRPCGGYAAMYRMGSRRGEVAAELASVAERSRAIPVNGSISRASA